MRAKNAAVCVVAVLLCLALATAAEAQNKGRGGGRGKGRRSSRQQQQQQAQPSQAQSPQQLQQSRPQPQQPQPRDWQAWDDDADSRVADPAFNTALMIEQDTLSPRAAERTADLTRQITLFSITLRSDYVLDPGERDTLFDLLDAVSGAIFNRMRPADNPPLNSDIVDDLLCGATSGADAKELCDQMARILEIKRKLSGPEALTSFHRAMLQAEHNWLVANLHDLPTPAKEAQAAGVTDARPE